VATVAPTPAATTAADDGSSVNWALLAVLVAIVLVLAAIIALVRNRSQAQSRERGTLHRRIAHVVGGAQWVHDQASLELIGSTVPPERLRVSWDDTRRRMNDLGAEVSTIAVGAHDKAVSAELRTLGHALGLLEGALDTSVGLRLRGGYDAGTVAATDESFVAVNERRHELRAALVPLARRV
jgi:hypothetical protein